jgi:hypothetical protein
VVGVSYRDPTGRLLARRPLTSLEPEIAFGQVFDNSNPGAVRARALARVRAAGLEPRSVTVYRPRQNAVRVVAIATDPAAYARQENAILTQLTGGHDFALYEGLDLEIRDRLGNVLRRLYSSPRSDANGSANRPDLRRFAISTAYSPAPPAYLVLHATGHWQSQPAQLAIPRLHLLIANLHWTRWGGPTATGIGDRYPCATSRCPAQRVVVRLLDRHPAGCDAAAYRVLDVRTTHGTVLQHGRIGDTPLCLS